MLSIAMSSVQEFVSLKSQLLILGLIKIWDGHSKQTVDHLTFGLRAIVTDIIGG